MVFPCGFCSQSTDQQSHCQLQPMKAGKAHSGCSQVYNFQIAAASKISKQKACTNVPLQCRFCTELHWKYNMVFHLQLKHPRWEENVNEQERDDFHRKILIDTEEETKLGIPDNLHGRVNASDVYDARRMGTLPVMRRPSNSIYFWHFINGLLLVHYLVSSTAAITFR